MEIEHWSVDPTLQKEAEDNYRTAFALTLKDQPMARIVQELTFDDETPKMTFKNITKLIRLIERQILKRPISGVGVEVGAGPGTFSALLARKSSVDRVYAVEICRPIVDLLAPKVVSAILGRDADKVVAVAGSFDEMRLVDDSVDFVFDFFSLHHSLDLAVTLRECQRVLRPGGFVLCFDKARPDHYSQQDLDELLDTVYGPAYYAHYGLPAEARLTRRNNGEREYRLKDWRAAFEAAGFSRFEHYYLAKTSGTSRISRAIKLLVSLLPLRLQQRIDHLIPRQKARHKFVLATQHRIFSRFINPFAKEISLMIAYK